MLNTQIRGVQCMNVISGSVANGDMFSDRQASLTLPSIPVHTRPEGQANSDSAYPSAHGHIEIRSKRCPEVYKVKKLYVGLLKELPPPTTVQETWDLEVRPDLERHLCQATSMLSKTLRDEEIITEAVLCMAGKKCSPSSVLLVPGTTCPEYPIVLKPAVWIHCGSKKCQKSVIGSIRNLAYLNHFLDKFGMEPPYVSLNAPWPAAREHPLGTPRGQEVVHGISFAVQRPASGWTTICGAKARFTIQTSDTLIQLHSTLGGMIIVGNSLFGLTSAHGIVNYVLQSSTITSIEEIEPTDTSSSDSDSGCETSSNSESETSDLGSYPSLARVTSSRRPVVADAIRLHETVEGMWMEMTLPKVAAYMGRGTIRGDYDFRSAAPETSDFTLVEIAPLPTLRNVFHDPVDQTLTDVSDIIPTSALVRGEVWIISSCCDRPLNGFLLEGNASIIIGGNIMRTKKIQVEFPSVPGLSGSWVVREGKLCGSIYAAYDRSPYLHMLPAESIFQDIAQLLHTSDIRVATTLDIHQHWSLHGRFETNNDGLALLSPQESKVAVPDDLQKGLRSPRATSRPGTHPRVWNCRPFHRAV